MVLFAARCEINKNRILDLLETYLIILPPFQAGGVVSAGACTFGGTSFLFLSFFKKKK